LNEVRVSPASDGAKSRSGIEGVTLQQVQRLVIFLNAGALPVLVNVSQVIPLLPAAAPMGAPSPAAA